MFFSELVRWDANEDLFSPSESFSGPKRGAFPFWKYHSNKDTWWIITIILRWGYSGFTIEWVTVLYYRRIFYELFSYEESVDIWWFFLFVMRMPTIRANQFNAHRIRHLIKLFPLLSLTVYSDTRFQTKWSAAATQQHTFPKYCV